MDANDVAKQIIAAIENKQFYIFTHDFSETVLRHRMQPIITGGVAGLREDQIEDYGVAKIQETLGTAK